MNFYSVGYVADLAALLAKRIGFEYKLVLVPDNKYGRMNKITGKWDGIMKELVEGVSMLSDIYKYKKMKLLPITCIRIPFVARWTRCKIM